MNISKEMQKTFTEDLEFVVKQMKESTEISTKMYYLSATFSCAQRIINIEFDEEMAFIQCCLQYTHQLLEARRQRLQQGQEKEIIFPPNLFERLEEDLSELQAKVEEGKETYKILQKISILAYSVTGNGYYLYSKGILKI